MNYPDKNLITEEILAKIPDKNQEKIEKFLEENISAKNLVKKILDEKRRTRPNPELEEAYKNKILEILPQE